jgi:hypothetical protein
MRWKRWTGGRYMGKRKAKEPEAVRDGWAVTWIEAP